MNRIVLIGNGKKNGGDSYSFDGAKLGLMIKYRGCCKTPLDTVINRPAAEKLNKFCIKI